MPFAMEYFYEDLHNLNLSYDTNVCKRLIGNSTNTKIMHQNIRSINKNFDELLIQLHHINIDFDIIFLTECWLSNTYTPKIIKNYTSHNPTIFNNQNDGIVVVYTKNNQNFTVTELKIQDPSCTQIKYNNDTVILAIYHIFYLHILHFIYIYILKKCDLRSSNNLLTYIYLIISIYIFFTVTFAHLKNQFIIIINLTKFINSLQIFILTYSKNPQFC